MNDHRRRHALLTAAFSCGLTLALSAYTVQQQHGHEGGTHRHPEAAQMKNPVAADATSIAAGKAVFQKNCAS
jgi:mono/diheme cytochrome c family protein